MPIDAINNESEFDNLSIIDGNNYFNMIGGGDMWKHDAHYVNSSTTEVETSTITQSYDNSKSAYDGTHFSALIRHVIF